MATIVIPCPECGSELRLRDRKLLGRRGKCPKCEHRFILEEPDEVELELADTSSVGVGAQWVPDSGAGSSSEGMEFEEIPESEVMAAAIASDVSSHTTNAGREKMKQLKTRKKKQLKMQIIIGGVIAVALAGTVFGLKSMYYSPQKKDSAEEKYSPEAIAKANNAQLIRTEKNEKGENVVVLRKGPQADEKWQADTAKMRNQSDLASGASPTSGKKITLNYMPDGVDVVINLHPSIIWGDAPHMQEFRGCLGPFASWLEAKITELTKFEPKQIEELTIGMILEGYGFEPSLCLLVRLVEPAKKSELIKLWGAAPNRDHGYPIYVGTKYAFILDDQDALKTFGMAPSLFAEEMIQHKQGTLGIQPGLEQLLLETDRDRHVTVLFQPKDLRVNQEFLVPEKLRPLLNAMLNWFGDEVETVSWSIHLGDPNANRPFFSELLLRNNVGLAQKPEYLHKKLTKKLKDLPVKIADLAKKMNPKTVGFRQIIGRFPAMLEDYRLKTAAGVGDRERFLQLTTVLPERAGPNLAAGLLLTWDEAMRTDFSAASTTTVAVNTNQQPSNLPGSLVDRLNMPIEIEFNRTPLQEAFAYIGQESKVQFEIDGDALKFSGFTKNMPQSQKMGMVTGFAAIKAIVEQYDGMCISIDQANKKVIVLTLQFAEQKGLIPYQFK